MTEHMGFNIFWKDATWHLLNATNDVYDEPTDAINNQINVSVRVDYPQFSAYGTFTKAWVGDDTAKLLAYTDVGVTEEDMNADFDAIVKFFYGRIHAVEHHVNYIVVKARQMLHKWLAEPVQSKDNVVATTAVTARNATTITLASSTGLANGRGLRVTHQASAGASITSTHTHVASPTEMQKSGLGSLSVYGNDADMDTDDSNSFSNREDHASAAVWVYCQLKFQPSSAPPKLAFTLVVKCGFCYIEVSSWAVNPTIQLYNFATSAWDVINTFTTTGTTGLATYNLNVTRDYYDATNNQVLVRVHGGRSNIVGGGVESVVYLQYAAITYVPGNDHPALTYGVGSSSGAVVTLSDGNPLEDLVNVGDTVDILYHEQEFLEDDASYGLAQSKYDSLVNSITFVPTTIKPTYSLFRWEYINNVASSINRRNGAFFYATRKTVSGKYDIVFRNEPVDNNLKITPEEFDGDDFNNAWNRDDKCRAVVVQNKSTWAARSSAGDHTATSPGTLPSNDLQIITLNMPELPDTYLLDYATAVYNFRNALGDDIIVPVRDVLIVEETGSTALVDEDFEAWADGENPDHDVTPAGETYMTHQVAAEGAASHFTVEDETLGGQAAAWGYYYKLGADDKYLRWWGEFDTPSPETPNAQNYIVYFDLYITNTRANIQLVQDAAGTYPPTVRCGVYGAVGAKWQRMATIAGTTDGEILWGGVSGANVAQDTLYHCAIKTISASQFMFSIDGGSTWSDAINNANNWSAAIKSIFTYGAGSWTEQFYITNIDASWTTIPTYDDVSYPVRSAADDALHVGAAIDVYAAPETKDDVDYQVDGETYLIRNIKWTKDRMAILFLGAAVATAQSPEQMLDEILTRHDHASTS